MKKGPSRTYLPGLRLGHVVEEQQVEVGVAGRDAGFSLLERIGDMNRSRFLPVIERVFDEFDRPDEIIRIDRLELDLGHFGQSELGWVEERLANALREALRKAMPPPGKAGTEAAPPLSGVAAGRGVGEALVDAFLHFLIHGAWPYGSALDLATAPAQLLARLIEAEPGALIAMLRRHGRSETVLQRLVRQMPPELLERLLALLEPADAAWILVYMKETKASHEEEPLVEESSDQFERLLWTIVLGDALNRAGLRANRRTFLRDLIAGIAEAGSASYADLLAQIGRGLAAVPGPGSGADSLLSIIAELGAEEQGVTPPPILPFEALVRMLEGGEAPSLGRRPGPDAPGSPERSSRRDTSADSTSLEGRALAQALFADRSQSRWLLRRLLAEQGEALLARLESLTDKEIARLMFSADQAKRVAAGLAEARGARAKAALLEAAVHGTVSSEAAMHGTVSSGADLGADPVQGTAGAGLRAGAGTGLNSTHGSAAPPATPAAGAGSASSGPDPGTAAWQMDVGAGFDSEAEAGPYAGKSVVPPLAGQLLDPGPAGLTPLARLERMLRLEPRGDRAEWMAGVSLLLTAAAAADPVGLRRAMRGFALADAAMFLDRFRPGAGPRPRPGPEAGIQSVLALLVPQPSAEAIAGLAAECSDAERVRLVRLAAALPASVSSETLVRRALASLSETRGKPAETIRTDLLGRARRSGGVASRRLAALLEAATDRVPIPADAPEARRARALDALKALLWTPGAARSADLERFLVRSNLSGIGPSALREHLDSASLDRQAAAAALGSTDEAGLLRLILALAPRGGAAKAELRRRLSGAPRRAALAAIAAELLVLGRLEVGEEGRSPPEPRPEPPAAAGSAAELQLVERALRAGGKAASTPAIRAAIANMLAARPIALIRLLASADRGFAGSAVAAILEDPAALPLAFAALPSGKRRLASSLAALLAGPSGRSAIRTEKAAAALTHAAVSMLSHPGGAGLAAGWLAEMLRAASLSERSRLRSLVAAHWPEGQADPEIRRLLGLADLHGETKEAARGNEPGSRRQEDGREARRLAPEKGSIAWLVQLLDERPTGYARLLRSLLRRPEARARLLRTLPEALRLRILVAISPGEGRALLRAAELVAAALQASGGALSHFGSWDAVLAVGASGGGVEDLLGHLLRGRSRPGLRLPSDKQASDRLWIRLADLARSRGHVALATALEEREHDRRRAERRAGAAKLDGRKPGEQDPKVERKLWDGADEEAGLRIAISNAGLVLAAPFLPTFFARLDLLDPSDPEGKSWRSDRARDRAIHLLQYLVEGRCDRPEPVLALNKLLCGQSLGFPVSASIDPTEEEAATCRSLLEAMVSNWPMLSGSSVEALQETFLQREGCIVRIEGGWRIDVERKVLDVLLDSVPWGFSMILHAWMTEPVSVAWGP